MGSTPNFVDNSKNFKGKYQPEKEKTGFSNESITKSLKGKTKTELIWVVLNYVEVVKKKDEAYRNLLEYTAKITKLCEDNNLDLNKEFENESNG